MRKCSAAIVIAWLISAACGSGGNVPDVPDSSPSDANPCTCPAADTLIADQILRRPYAYSVGNFGSPSVGVNCEESDRLIGGGCFQTPLSPISTLYHGGYDPVLDGWFCGWYTRTASTITLETVGVCLQPSPAPPEPPSSCDCAPIEPISDRIFHIERAGILAGNSVYRLTSACDPDQVFVGGGCWYNTTGPSREPTLISSGFNAEGTEWACTWKNPTTASFAASATATCIRPPTPGTAPELEPLTERIDIITQTTTLPASDAHVTDVSCAPGDFLLWGSCTLDNPDAHPDVTMFRSGFLPPDQNRPNTWQCAWNNPTALTPAAAATAVCLTPPMQ